LYKLGGGAKRLPTCGQYFRVASCHRILHTARTGNLISRIIMTRARAQYYGSSYSNHDPRTDNELSLLVVAEPTTAADADFLCAFPICILPVIIYGRKARK